jgi:formamidopyrimidine-DNA glycosylase
MPELPEVETVRLSLIGQVVGRRIIAAEVLRPASIGYPKPAEFCKGIIDREIIDIDRRGKYLLFKLDGGTWLGAHLRMSGRLLLTGSTRTTDRATKTASKSKRANPDHAQASDEIAVSQAHVRVRMKLDDGSQLIFEDMRVFGRLWYVPPNKRLEDVIPALKELGPEPLTQLTSEYLVEALAGRKQAIKTALLDQTLIAGVGNIYADESLHLAGINPQRTAGSIKPAEMERLCKHIKAVLAKAIKLRGSSLRNYTDASGVNGDYQLSAYVYGRYGAPCHNCKTAIKRVKLAGRSSHFCPTCQPMKASRSASK